MRRSTTLVATLAAVLVAIGAPILAAIQIASREAEKAEIGHTLGYARDVLSRSETTADQVDKATRLLAAVASPDPCSARSIDLMRRIDSGFELHPGHRPRRRRQHRVLVARHPAG